MATAVFVSEPVRRVHAAQRIKTFSAPELDALRFGAFLLVFFRHLAVGFGMVKVQAGPSGGPAHMGVASAAVPLAPVWRITQSAIQALDFGVCLFFFLSAFLITRLLLIERQNTGTVGICHFYVRRCLRIWPLYFTFLMVVGAMSQFLPFLEITPYRMWAAVFFVSNWAAVLHGWSCVAIQPLWSVSVEEQFYIVWPNFARFGRKAIIIASSVLVLTSLGALFYLGSRPAAEVTQSWPNTLVQSLFLAGGALTACLSTPEDSELKTHVRLFLIALGFAGWIVASVTLHIVRTQSPGPASLIGGYLLVLFGTYLIFKGVVGWNATPVPPLLGYLGKISYGLYVFHTTCLIVSERIIANTLRGLHVTRMSAYGMEGISGLLAFAVTLCLAAGSYKYLEAPFLRLKERFTVVPSRVV